MARTRVGVIRGGKGAEFEVSLKTGKNVLTHLPENYEGIDILITKDGTWHVNGIPQSLFQISRRADVIWNGLHGEYGEDGKVQQELEMWKIPYTGSSVFASALSINKEKSKERFKEKGIRTPFSLTVKKTDALLEDIAFDLFRKIPNPSIVKPVSLGSSVGMTLVTSIDSLYEALERGFLFSDALLIEEFIRGKEATVGVIDGFRGEKIYALPPIEIRLPQSKTFFDYEAKYGGDTEEVCPGNFSKSEREELLSLASLSHNTLGLRDYSRTDFITTPRGVYVLESNALPGLTESSLLPKALSAVGATLPQFLDHVLTHAFERK